MRAVVGAGSVAPVAGVTSTRHGGYPQMPATNVVRDDGR